MSAIASVAASGAKGFRGVAQDFLAPELRALTERVHALEKSVDQRFESLEKLVDLRFDQVDQRFALIDQRFAQVDQRFTQLEKSIDQRFEKLEARMDRLEGKIDAMPTQFSQSIDRLIAALDVSNRLASIESRNILNPPR